MTPSLKVLRARGRTARQPDRCSNRFTTHRIGYTEYSRLGDGRMALQYGINLRRLHFEA